MKDIKLLEVCEYCGENLTLMESVNTDTDKLMLVKRCLKCGGHQLEEVVEVQCGGTEKILWTNGNAFRKYQGQDKRKYAKTDWKKVRAIIRDIV